MFGPRFNLFRILGFQIRIDLSWFIIVALLSWSLATGVFPHYLPDRSPAEYWTMGVVGALGLFVSILLHELSHALIARRFGVEMAGITLFVFGGVAEMRDEPPSAQAEFAIAIAGPIASVLIGVVCLLFTVVGSGNEWPSPILGVVGYLAAVNLILVAFNMLPAFPLDGGRVLRAVLWSVKGNLRWATKVTSSIGSGFGAVFIAAGVFFIISGEMIGGIWWVVIGLFLRGAAGMAYQQLIVRRALEGERVSRFMTENPIVVDPELTLERLVDEYIYRYGHKLFPVVRDGDLIGCVTLADVQRTPKPDRASVRVGEVCHQCTQSNTIDADADALHALERMNRDSISRLVVVRDGALAGVLSLKDLLQFLSLKIELENWASTQNIAEV
ncbi:MAG: site-2 protease family protein [Phycisphaerales bacterium]